MLLTTKIVPNVHLIEAWLEGTVRPALTPDVSNYAKGRLRVWLCREPMLFAPFNVVPAFPVADNIMARLAELIEWRFDFCLVTYSGDAQPVGITPHYDAGYAAFEARSIHVSGECRFDYWMDRPEVGPCKGRDLFTLDRKTYTVLGPDGKPADPTASVRLVPGEVTTFNCKNPHSATPGPRRWNINFWRAKPQRTA